MNWPTAAAPGDTVRAVVSGRGEAQCRPYLDAVESNVEEQRLAGDRLKGRRDLRNRHRDADVGEEAPPQTILAAAWASFHRGRHCDCVGEDAHTACAGGGGDRPGPR